MLAGGGDEAYRGLLRTGGRFVCRVEVHRAGARIDGFGDEGVKITSGSLSAQLTNRVSRKVTLSVPATLFPWGDLGVADTMDPLGNELVIYAGWRGGVGATYEWPVFTGPIVTASMQTDSATCSITASDRAESVIEDKFTSPTRSGAGVTAASRIIDIITDSYRGARFVDVDETYSIVPELTWEDDRAKAADDLASAAGCFWYQLPDGNFTIRRVPWAGTSLSSPVAEIRKGDTSTQISVSSGRDGIYNHVQVSGEPANGAKPVSGDVQDEDPLSRTYINGLLGRRVLKVQEDSVSQLAQAQSLARQRLRRSTSQVLSIDTSSPFDPSLELGDTVSIIVDNRSFPRSLVSFTTSLTGTPIMSSTWRAAGGNVDE